MFKNGDICMMTYPSNYGKLCIFIKYKSCIEFPNANCIIEGLEPYNAKTLFGQGVKKAAGGHAYYNSNYLVLLKGPDESNNENISESNKRQLPTLTRS